MRKAGLSLLTGCKGAAKPACFVEDTAVRPRDLPAYFNGLQQLMAAGRRAGFLLRPRRGGIAACAPGARFAQRGRSEKIPADRRRSGRADFRQFKGTLAGEHGVGIARTEFLKDQVGDELYQLMREIKQSFDPNNLFNPGKIISDGRYTIDRHLRLGAGYSLNLPFEPRLAFAAKDDSFTANLEQCNGCGGCLKQTPTMCPTFIATGEEIMSTRGRANAIRAALELREIKGDPLHSPELEAALGNCLSCKACTTECPSNVNLALLKAELLHARIHRDGLKLRERLFSSVDQLGRWGCKMPRLANALQEFFPARLIRNRLLGITTQRPMPRFARHAI